MCSLRLDSLEVGSLFVVYFLDVVVVVVVEDSNLRNVVNTSCM